MDARTNVRFDDGRWREINLSRKELKEISDKLAKVLLREIRQLRRGGRGTGREELQAITEATCQQVDQTAFGDSLKLASKIVKTWPKWKRDALRS